MEQEKTFRPIDPRGDIKLQTSSKTLLIQPFFYAAKTSGEEPETPLKVFNSFSRWVVTIIDTNAVPKAVSHNISINRNTWEYDEFSGAAEDGLCMEKAYHYGLKRAEKGPDGPAYTVKLFAKPFSGMTPAAVLSSNPDNIEKLSDVYRLLERNLSAYPGNKGQMDAITDAIRRLKEGTLQSVRTDVTELYRSVPKPNRWKAAEDGFCPTSELRLLMTHGNDYPFTIEIVRYFAPAEVRENGSINVIRSRKRDLASHSFSLSFGAMRGILAEMDRQVRGFYYTHYVECEREAIREEKRQYDMAKGEKSS